MAGTAARVPRGLIAAAVAECLRAPGRPISDIPKAERHAGDPASLPFACDSAWHTKPEIDRCVAARLKLDAGRVVGPFRDDSDLYAAVSAAISSLRKAGIIQDWKAGSGLGVWRLTGRPLPPAADLSMSTARGGPFSGEDAAGPGGRHPQLYCVFTGIIESGRKDNTYKFALARALLEYSHANRESGGSRLVVPYRYLALRFAEYYWRLDCVFNLRQALNKSRTPAAVSAVRRARDGAGPGGSHLSLDASRRARAESDIRRSVFGHARTKTSAVVPRFQNVSCATGAGGARREVKPNPVFYSHSDDDQEIRLRPEAFDLFRNYYHTLMWATLDGWTRYIKRANPSERVDAAVAKALEAPRSRAPPPKLVAELPARPPSSLGTTCRHCASSPAVALYGSSAHLDAWSRIFDHGMRGRVRQCRACRRRAPAQMPPAPPCLCLPVGRRRAA